MSNIIQSHNIHNKQGKHSHADHHHHHDDHAQNHGHNKHGNASKDHQALEQQKVLNAMNHTVENSVDSGLQKLGETATVVSEAINKVIDELDGSL